MTAEKNNIKVLFENVGANCFGTRGSNIAKRSFKDRLASAHRLDAQILSTQEAELQQVVEDFVAEQEAGIPPQQLYGTVPHAIIPE